MSLVRVPVALGSALLRGLGGLLSWLWRTGVQFWRTRRGRPGGKRSLRVRLCLYFGLFLVAAWGVAAFFAWKECRESIHEFFDTQQLLFARRLAVDPVAVDFRLPEPHDVIPGSGKRGFGKQEEDALAFAVFTRNGEQVLSDGKEGGRFLFFDQTRGFVNMPVMDSKDLWRIVWVESVDGRHLVAVGQELEYRSDLALDMLEGQIFPWLLLLPVLLGGLVFLVSRELGPLRTVSRQLREKVPDDPAPLGAEALPGEVRPLVYSLNEFFARTGAMMARERAFISDAAHELRTPLAGLSVQAQVAADIRTTPEQRSEALANLRSGIDRSTRLVEQLLALSRLEAMEGLAADGHVPPLPKVDMAALLREELDQVADVLKSRNIAADREISSVPGHVRGNAALLGMLVRNIIGNAVAYTPAGGRILVRLEYKRLILENSSAGLREEYAKRLGERFFRPPGQEHPGSGLGLSIVKKIAELHGIGLKVEPEGKVGIFRVTLFW